MVVFSYGEETRTVRMPDLTSRTRRKSKVRDLFSSYRKKGVSLKFSEHQLLAKSAFTFVNSESYPQRHTQPRVAAFVTAPKFK